MTYETSAEREALNEFLNNEVLGGLNEESVKLEKFYDEHLQGHKVSELTLGNDICVACYDLWHTLTEEQKEAAGWYVFDRSLDDLYIEKYHEAHPEHDIQYLRQCFDVAQAWQCYSDWYKEVNWVRPHVYGEVF